MKDKNNPNHTDINPDQPESTITRMTKYKHADNPNQKGLKELEMMVISSKKIRYPNVPEFARVKPKIETLTANGLTKAILTWLELNGHYASRIQSQGQWNQALGRFTRSTVKKGIGDVMAIINGHTVMIEVKIGKDKLSEAQIKTREEVGRSGGLYWIIKEFDSFMKNYKELTKQIKL